MAAFSTFTVAFCTVCTVLFTSPFIECGKSSDELVVITVATNETDGYKRFMRSAKVYDINVKVLGLNTPWQGGDIVNSAGGGHKVNLLKEEVEKFKNDKDKIIMFVDSYDVILLADAETILDKFYKFKAKVVFSAEGFCWPDKSLAEKYPEITQGKRYLNSGGFLGYAPDLFKLITTSKIDNLDDDQLFYTKIYLDEKMRKKYSIKLDHRAEIFQNLNGAVGDVELRFRNNEAYLSNTAYATNPAVVHGNGPSKVTLNNLGNYLAKSWEQEAGCPSCQDNLVNLENIKSDDFPKVMIGIFVESPTPFLKEFLERISLFEYPKEKVDLFIHNAAIYHADDVDDFVYTHKNKYKSIKQFKPVDGVKEWHARNLGLEECLKQKCDYYLSVDSVAMLTNPKTLKILIEQNRSVIAPLLVRPSKVWSNFWGALSPDGFYARSSDYMEIVNNKRRGVWNVPYMTATYLINATLLKSRDTYPTFINNLLDSDMAFCKNLREKGVFMFVTNQVDFGHLINNENYDISHLHNDLYQVFDNRIDWEARYLHENYSKALHPDHASPMPCPDVFWFPIVSPQFCKELIDTMENFGKWSDGTNHDERLNGGYENVPTRDIHMNQVGYERHWLYFLREFVRPLQEKVYPGYYHDPPQALMNFVVRYRPDEQPFLRPHHDSSTYTINLALNRPKIDYEGGGCRFLRYNCSVTDTRLGWLLMHPGRLTHYHEGLSVTKGTRYIMISFVDP
uniref:Fe2OG dioxygenase domain-containing protein n=1 Tax=Strigamia maritima TaxID=126957 RepID=T1IVE2_STRMM